MAIPFAKIVRAELAVVRPAYKFTATTGGSGPLVHFNVPTGVARVTQTLVVQKGLYGANWLRVNVITSFVDRSGDALQLLQRTAPKLDAEFANDAECRTAIAGALPQVDAHLARDRKAVAKLVGKLASLLDGLPKHAAAWMTAEGHALDPALFDDDDFALAAFKRFVAWLKKQKLWVAQAESPVWWWWTDHTPKPRGKVGAKGPAARNGRKAQ
jgi:hypothetical protein